ncbi:MAG: hypothetical protein C0608_05355 [Deltaproteobacteria bacterium]|nr:MAG: hypothetical protein C0608_05355 [Deltaproteobacteria bacterium]
MEAPLKQVLEQLGDLQGISDEIDKMELLRREALSELDAITERLEAARNVLEDREEKHHAIDIERRKKELQLREEKERHQRIKGRVGEVKTSREYQAVISETSSVKQAINQAEEGLLADMEALEGATNELKKAKETVAGIESEEAEAKAKYDKVCAETEEGISAGRAREREILNQMPPAIVSQYDLIRSRCGGVAVAEAKDEACTACFMKIPPQRYIEVLRANKVHQCPNCYRILIPPRG